MTTYARIADGVVAELIQHDAADDIKDFFPGAVVAMLVKLSDRQAGEVQTGWLYDGTRFQPPEPAESQASRIITPRAFRLRFTTEEKLSLTLAASKGLEAGDATLQVFLDDLSAADQVYLDHPEILEGMEAIVKAGLITKARAKKILE